MQYKTAMESIMDMQKNKTKKEPKNQGDPTPYILKIVQDHPSAFMFVNDQ